MGNKLFQEKLSPSSIAVSSIAAFKNEHEFFTLQKRNKTKNKQTKPSKFIPEGQYYLGSEPRQKRSKKAADLYS